MTRSPILLATTTLAARGTDTDPADEARAALRRGEREVAIGWARTRPGAPIVDPDIGSRPSSDG